MADVINACGLVQGAVNTGGETAIAPLIYMCCAYPPPPPPADYIIRMVKNVKV